MRGFALFTGVWVRASVSDLLWSRGKLFGHLQKVPTEDAAFNIPLVC